MSYATYSDICCESAECETDCKCDTHTGCDTCGSSCDCMCDEMYENWKDSQYE